jgi:hypothetical protein
MEREIPDTQVAQIAYDCYNFFKYVSDYFDAQDRKTVMLRGKRYRRIRSGEGREYWGDEPVSAKEIAEYKASASVRPCHDCGVIKGEFIWMAAIGSGAAAAMGNTLAAHVIARQKSMRKSLLRIRDSYRL